MVKLCIRYDLAVETECNGKDYLYVAEVDIVDNRINWGNIRYIEMVVKYGT
ncbi:hypothetical protein V6M85_03040 [Sulfolobus tengchongensis]|uniref:Uncharacterized protein n=1 Tax=Sulfolobus tengchongensis TaxID=207809 RepID=A0AAX4L2C9_9CREN